MIHFVSFLFPLLFSISLFAASSKQTTLVVQSLSDPHWEEAGEKTVEILRQKLKENRSLYVVESQNVEAVLKYYEGSSLKGEPAVQEIKELLFQGKEHYFQFAYAEAEAELKKLISIFEKNPGFIFANGQDLVDGWLTLGLVWAAEQKSEKALEAFQQVYKLAPFYSLDTKTFSPSVRKLFAEAQSGVKDNSAKGNLVIAGEPKVSEVYLNGVYQGVSPLTLSALPAGEYALSFKAHHYQTIDQHLVIKPEETRTIQHKLYWQGPKGHTAKAEVVSIREEVQEGVRMAELLKVDKVLFVQVDEKNISGRLIDRSYRASHKPIVIAWEGKTDRLEENLNKLARLIFAQTELNLLRNPQAHLDPNGIDDPILLGQPKKKIAKGVWIGGLGALGVGGVLAAILSAGGASSPQTGTLALSFK